VAVYVALIDGRPTGVRHLDLWCSASRSDLSYAGKRRWSHPAGELAYLPNAKVRSLAACHCLRDSVEPAGSADERWLEPLRLEDVVGGVYEVSDAERRLSQIGMTSGSVYQRLRKRHRASAQRRLAPDSIWWLHDLLCDGRQPNVRVLPVEPGETLRAAEHRWRETRRAEGWQVTSHT
jgi:hypothetical protein